jgi:hypothetical protein
MSSSQVKKSTKQAKAATAVPAVSEATTVAQDVSSSTVAVDVKAPAKKRGAAKAAAVEVAASAPAPAPVQVVEPVVVAPVVVAVAAVASPAVAVAEEASVPAVEVEEQSEDSFETFDDVQQAISNLDKELVSLNRRRTQLNKIAQKKYVQLSRQHKKRSKGDGKATKRSVSGFNKPAHVPAAFCAYLGLNPSEQLPRTNITALLYKSIKDNNLLNPEDKRQVQATPALRTLLKMEEGENLRFENFQHYVSRVYKAEAAALAAAGTDGSATDGGSASATE